MPSTQHQDVKPKKHEGNAGYEGPEEVDDVEHHAVEQTNKDFRSLRILQEIRIKADRVHDELSSLCGSHWPAALTTEGEAIRNLDTAEPTVRRITKVLDPRDVIKILS